MEGWGKIRLPTFHSAGLSLSKPSILPFLRTVTYFLKHASAAGFSFTCQPRLFSATGGETTTIVFSLQKEASVTLKVYNLDGRLQRTLVSGDRLYAGRNAVLWDGRDESDRLVPSSLYLIALSIDDQKVETKTVVVQNR